MMAKTDSVESHLDLLPTDPNLRPPGLRPTLEELATDVNPYVLEILSRTNPAMLDNIPQTYTSWNAHVGLLFIRAHRDGVVSLDAYREIEKYLEENSDKGSDTAWITKIMMKTPGSGRGNNRRTQNGWHSSYRWSHPRLTSKTA